MNEKLASNDNGDIDYGQWRTFTNPDAHEYESLPEEMPSPEEKKAELTFEKMAELSTEEYLELWKHLNPFYVTHVTRQGVRDHNSMIYHSGGMGATMVLRNSLRMENFYVRQQKLAMVYRQVLRRKMSRQLWTK